MSRCFPFPPPGYEKKPRPEEDLLKEEKRREKNHKRDKKDKEKKEGKDKKERDKSDGKHKEKDKKEKRRDKKEKDRDTKDKDKDKEKYKDKEKSSISEDANVAGQPETRNGEKLHTRDACPKDNSVSSEEKKFALPFPGQNGQKPNSNKLLAGEIEESKFVQELGRRIRDEEKAMGSKPIEGSSGANSRGNEEKQKFPVSYPHDFAEEKVKNGERKVDNGGVEGQGLRDNARCIGNTIVQNLAGPTEHKVERMPGLVQRDTEEKNKSKEKGDEKRGEKRKDKDKRDKKGKKDKDKKDKKSHGKDKGREKDKKKEEKTEGTVPNKNGHDRSKELYGNEFTGSNNNNSSHLPTYNNKHGTSGENLKKRKAVETNGFMHENEVRPDKVSRPTSHQLSGNGRILEACQTPSLLASDKQELELELPSQDRRDDKEWRVNGIIEAPSSYALEQKPPVAAARPDQVIEALKKPPRQADQVVEASRKLPLANQVSKASKKHRQADQIAEPSKKPPHPDSKYFSQVLCVPKMEEWSEEDDQEWLFSSSKGPLSKKPEMGAEPPCVWSEALYIESADIYALPYVIPY